MRLALVVVVGGLAVVAGPSLLRHLPAAPSPPPPALSPPITRPAPPRPAGDNSREMYIPADSAHQCYADAWLKGPNGREAKYSGLLDTGAGAKVILNRQQAAELGFTGLTYEYRVETANGTGKAAKVQLAQFRMGGTVNGYRLANVETWVDYNGLGNPLIGAEILRMLSFQIRDGSCTVTLPDSADVSRWRREW